MGIVSHTMCSILEVLRTKYLTHNRQSKKICWVNSGLGIWEERIGEPLSQRITADFVTVPPRVDALICNLDIFICPKVSIFEFPKVTIKNSQ